MKKGIYTGPVKSAVLTHMRAVAYAPIPERADTRDQAAIMAAAEEKRRRRADKAAKQARKE